MFLNDIISLGYKIKEIMLLDRLDKLNPNILIKNKILDIIDVLIKYVE